MVLNVPPACSSGSYGFFHVIEVVETGKQMLMTRGALTTFSIANDLAKYFAIIPAAFVLLLVLTGVA